MPNEVRIDMSNIVGAIAGVLMAPYLEFVAKLHAEGRVSDAELAELRRQFDERIPRLAELTQERLAELDHDQDEEV